MNAEQLGRLVGVCAVSTFDPGAILFREGGPSDRLYVVLEGEAAIAIESAARPIDSVAAGECLGDLSLLTHAPHSATATARTVVETAVLDRRDLAELVHLRPDIGIQIYKNLAIGLEGKLRRMDSSRS